MGSSPVAAGKDREVAVCMVALQLLAARRGSDQVEVCELPDQTDRQLPAVDLIVRDQMGEFAVEHTGLDSFPGQRDEGAWLAQALVPLEQELSGTLGAPGTFWLVVPHGALQGLPGGRRPAVLRRLREWVCTAAPALQVGSPQTAPAHSETGPTELGGVRLQRWPGPAGGKLVVVRAPPEELRRLVADVALDRKAPKLEQAREGHRTTALVLEIWDEALANAGLVKRAVADVCRLFTGPIPDVIVQVDTTISPWAGQILWEQHAIQPGASS
jgi:hypothetical protein